MWGKLRMVAESLGLMLVYAVVIGILMFPVWSAVRVF